MVSMAGKPKFDFGDEVIVPMAQPEEILAHGAEEDQARLEIALAEIQRRGYAKDRAEAIWLYGKVVDTWEAEHPLDGQTRHG